MKIEVNIEKRYFYVLLSVIIISAGFLIVGAYGTSVPTTFGHSVGEMNWDGTIANLKATQICIGTDCKTAWPAGGGSAAWSDITGKPAFAANAVSGRARMLEIGCSGSYASSCDVSGDGWPDYANTAGTVPWSGVTSKSGVVELGGSGPALPSDKSCTGYAAAVYGSYTVTALPTGLTVYNGVWAVLYSGTQLFYLSGNYFDGTCRVYYLGAGSWSGCSCSEQYSDIGT